MFGKVSTFITHKKYEVFYMDLVDFAALFRKTALVFFCDTNVYLWF